MYISLNVLEMQFVLEENFQLPRKKKFVSLPVAAMVPSSK